MCTWEPGSGDWMNNQRKPEVNAVILDPVLPVDHQHSVRHPQEICQQKALQVKGEKLESGVTPPDPPTFLEASGQSWALWVG